MALRLCCWNNNPPFLFPSAGAVIEKHGGGHRAAATRGRFLPLMHLALEIGWAGSREDASMCSQYFGSHFLDVASERNPSVRFWHLIPSVDQAPKTPPCNRLAFVNAFLQFTPPVCNRGILLVTKPKARWKITPVRSSALFS